MKSWDPPGAGIFDNPECNVEVKYSVSAFVVKKMQLDVEVSPPASAIHHHPYI